jgi:ribosome biogenesis GTPase
VTKDLIGTVLAVQANFYRVSLLTGKTKAIDRQNSLASPASSIAIANDHKPPTNKPNEQNLASDYCPPAIPDHLNQSPCAELLCIRRARLKKTGQRVCVGDLVEVESPDWQGQRGAIAKIYPRRNLLERPPIANVNRALLMFSLSDPEPDAYQISRFLVNIEAQGLEICLALNKSDLVSEQDTQAWCDRLKSWGYDPIVVSTAKQTNIDQLRRSLCGGITVVSGPSGVGKSSLINLLIPDLELRTGAVSSRSGHGRHTTRHVELFDLQLPQASQPDHQLSLIADTPGFTQPAITCHSSALASCFPEIKAKLKNTACQFNNCMHQEEPECVVRGDWERYEHYGAFLAEVLAQEAKQQAIANPDASLKQMSSAGGEVQTEPRLRSKKHRRISRRRQQQELEDLYQEELAEE